MMNKNNQPQMTKISKKFFTTEDFSIVSEDGRSEIFIRQFSQGKPNIHLFLVHGALEHSGRYQDLINFFLKNYPNIIVTTYDHLGHGKSGGTRVYVDNFDYYVKDFINVSKVVFSKNSTETKTFLLSHSLGGLISLSGLLLPTYVGLIEKKIHGLILSSPCIRPKVILKSLSYSTLERLSSLTSKLHLPMIYSGKDLTSDSLRANDFETDPLIPKYMTVGMIKEIFDASEKIVGESYYLNVPSLFLISGHDKIVDSRSTLRFTQGIEKKFVQVKIFDHLKHELWNEVERFSIFKEMKAWLDNHR